MFLIRCLNTVLTGEIQPTDNADFLRNITVNVRHFTVTDGSDQCQVKGFILL